MYFNAGLPLKSKFQPARNEKQKIKNKINFVFKIWNSFFEFFIIKTMEIKTTKALIGNDIS